MKLFEFVDKAYYINLEARKDKRELIEEHFRSLGIDTFVQRFKAIEPTQLGFVADENGIYSHLPTSKACLYSHLAIIEKAKKENLNNVLIFEDDARFFINDEYDFQIVIEKAIDCLMRLQEWDVLFLGTDSGTRDDYFDQYGEHLVKTNESLGTHALIINNTAFDFILEHSKDAYALDIFLSTSMNNKYLVYPMVAYQSCGLMNDVGQNFTGYNIDFWKKTYRKKLIKKG